MKNFWKELLLRTYLTFHYLLIVLGVLLVMWIDPALYSEAMEKCGECSRPIKRKVDDWRAE